MVTWYCNHYDLLWALCFICAPYFASVDSLLQTINLNMKNAAEIKKHKPLS